MGKKSRLKKERKLLPKQENIFHEDRLFMSTGKSTGIYIEGGSDNYVGENTIIGYDRGVVIKDSLRTDAINNRIISKDSKDLISAITIFINKVESDTDKLNLSKDLIEELQSDIQTIRAQIQSPNLKSSILTPCFESIKNILENATGSAIAEPLKEGVKNIISAITS